MSDYDFVPMDFHERCLRIEIEKRMALEKEMPKWISVEKDGLPKEPGEYLVYVRCGFHDMDIPELDVDPSYVTTAYFNMDSCLWNECQEYYNGNLDCVNKEKTYYISHWADRPAPPKDDA